MRIKDAPIRKIEHVPPDHRRYRHKTPVHGQATDPEGIGNERGIDAEESPIRKAAETAHNPQPVRIINVESCDLRAGEDATAANKAPEAGHV